MNLERAVTEPLLSTKEAPSVEMLKHTAVGILLVLLPLLLSACATPKRPVLYPNNHLRMVGSAQAQADIEACMQWAYASGADEGKGSRLIKDTSKAGAVGAATGAVVGAISSSGDAGRGAAMGGAGAATARLVSGAFEVSNPSPIFMQFVDRCLRERGYDPLGWR